MYVREKLKKHDSTTTAGTLQVINTHQTHPSKKMVITFVGGAMVTLGGCTVAQMKAGVIPHNFASNFCV